jgi:hypothetical protein
MMIRPDQIAALDTALKARFIGQIASYLRANHPTAEIQLPGRAGSIASLREPYLRMLIANGIERACQHKLEFESNQMAFVVLMFLVAPNFDEYPPVARILKAHEQIADFRFHRVWEDLTDADWQNAKRNYHAAAWGIMGA